VIDTETLPGPAQPLRLLFWRFYRDPPGAAQPGATCIEEGVAYPDDLPETDPDGWNLILSWTADRAAEVAVGFPARVRLEPVSWLLQERFFRYGFAHRDRCALVGFNLLFDLGRLALHWPPAKGEYRGGYSLCFWGDFDESGRWHDMKHRGRLRLRALDPRRTLFSWASRGHNDPDPPRGPGRFVDLRTLAFALTDRPHTLESACAAFGDHYEKKDVDYDELSGELLDYALADVRHTATLYRNCLVELTRHRGVELEAHRLYSPATVGARYLEALGLRRPLLKFTGLSVDELGWRRPGWSSPVAGEDEPRGDLDPLILGYSMSAFYGGRAEARIVRTEVPVVLTDMTSMYTTVNALLGSFQLLRADRIKVVDATKHVRRLVAHPGLFERCFTAELWREIGFTLVELEPDGDLLPSRAHYDPASADYAIGLNPISYQGRLWYMLPDVVAAVILSPFEHGAMKVPRIVRVLRLEPRGEQAGLRPVALRGGRIVDPLIDEPFVCMIEERHRVLADESLDPEECGRRPLFLKITASATSYGALARFDRREAGKPVELTVYGPDAEPRRMTSRTPEDPGPFCFPPIAASTTAGARLMLALLERLVRDHGGHYAFCDTDSMAIVATPNGGRIRCRTADGADTINALAWPTVEGLLARFAPLNPYDRELVPALWKIEADSLTRPLWCYAISAKRYVLHRRTNKQPRLVAAIDTTDAPDTDDPASLAEQLADWSEHGLGLYLDPTAPDPDTPRRDDRGRRLWVAKAWEWILANARGLNPPLPPWATSYALTRFTVSSPRVEAWFAGYNATRPRPERIRPGTFGLLAHPHPLTAPGVPLPAATYEPNPDRWPALNWYDRRGGKPLRVTTLNPDDDPEARAEALARGDVPIQLLRDVLSNYAQRAEHKSLDPNGQPAGPATEGLLQRRSITSNPHLTELTGKEGNKLQERATGEVQDPDDYRNTYGPRSGTWPLVVRVLHEIDVPQIVELTGFSRSAVYGVLHGSIPRTNRARVYEEVAAAWATKQLTKLRPEARASTAERLAAYLAEHENRGEGRRCRWCQKPLDPTRRRDTRFCSGRCRWAAARAAPRAH
jgi:hypothetical protein